MNKIYQRLTKIYLKSWKIPARFWNLEKSANNILRTKSIENKFGINMIELQMAEVSKQIYNAFELNLARIMQASNKILYSCVLYRTMSKNCSFVHYSRKKLLAIQYFVSRKSFFCEFLLGSLWLFTNNRWFVFWSLLGHIYFFLVYFLTNKF